MDIYNYIYIYMLWSQHKRLLICLRICVPFQTKHSWLVSVLWCCLHSETRSCSTWGSLMLYSCFIKWIHPPHPRSQWINHLFTILFRGPRSSPSLSPHWPKVSNWGVENPRYLWLKYVKVGWLILNYLGWLISTQYAVHFLSHNFPNSSRSGDESFVAVACAGKTDTR